MYIFINKRCLFKPFSYETWVCFWTMFQNFDHLPSSSSLDPPPNFSCIDQSLIPPLNNNFHVINQKKKIFFSCSHCSCTIFILPSYSLHKKVMPILILINVQYLQIIVFNFEKGLNVEKHSSDSNQPIKHTTSPQKSLSFLPHPLQ